jgi:Domain of unknown function (DUF4864)
MRRYLPDKETGSMPMRAVVLLVALLLCIAAPAGAADISDAQTVIRSQEQAFARDDAATAYSFASPGIQEIFPRADVFMEMVRQGYAPVYRHQRFEFGEAQVADGYVAQQVHIVDEKGEAWEALYTLEEQPDGSLKITGCSLLRAGQSA